jgi:glycosyltransferase involved in cell wall biosynthesis
MTKENKNGSRKPFSVGYFSAYYRGLECLLDMWTEIRKRIPNATLDVYYGWESWVAMQGEDDFYVRMERKFDELKSEGVTVHGRVSHTELAKAMRSIQVWAYPTEFTEIHCITALKAQEAGCYPVTTNVGALAETVRSGTKINTRRIYSDTYKQGKFIDAVCEALTGGLSGNPVPDTSWRDVASQWDTVIKGKS